MESVQYTSKSGDSKDYNLFSIYFKPRYLKSLPVLSLTLILWGVCVCVCVCLPFKIEETKLERLSNLFKATHPEIGRACYWI